MAPPCLSATFPRSRSSCSYPPRRRAPSYRALSWQATTLHSNQYQYKDAVPQSSVLSIGPTYNGESVFAEFNFIRMRFGLDCARTTFNFGFIMPGHHLTNNSFPIPNSSWSNAGSRINFSTTFPDPKLEKWVQIFHISRFQVLLWLISNWHYFVFVEWIHFSPN